MTTTYTITTNTGRTVTRRSDTHYVAASERQDNGRVRFHQSRAAARRAAGTYGTVHDIADQAPAAPANPDRQYEVEERAGGSKVVWAVESDGRRHIWDMVPAGEDPYRNVTR